MKLLTYLALLVFCVLFWTPLHAQKKQRPLGDYPNRYAADLGPDEELLVGHQQFTITRKGDHYIRRFYYYDTKTLTDYVECLDPDCTIFDGEYRRYLPDGTPLETGIYTQGKQTGEWTAYAPRTGALFSIGTYDEAGRKTGVWKYYTSEGEVSKQSTYAQGLLDGEDRYSENDSTEIVDIYTKGKLTTRTYYRNDEEITAAEVEISDRVRDQVELMPLFPGCPGDLPYGERKQCADRKMLEFIYGNVRYPGASRRRGLQGMAVVSFIIEKDGRVTDPFVIRGVDDHIRKEVLRIVSLLPIWEPGRVDGEPVRVQFNLPVNFRLE